MRYLAPMLCLLAWAWAPGRLQAQDAPPTTEGPSTFERALDMAGNGEVDQAVELLRAAVADSTATPQDRSLLGALLIESGAQQEAYDLLLPMATPQDAEPAVLYNAGRAAAALGRSDEAVTFLERSVALEPDSPAGRELGLLVARDGRWAYAYSLLKPWVAAHTDDSRAAEIAALCAVQLDRPTEAEALLSGLPQDEPRIQILWAQVRQMRGDPWGAIALLEPLLESTSEAMERDVRRQLAEAHMTVGDAETAVDLLRGRTEGDPRMALQLARALYQSGDVEGALGTLEPIAPPVLSRYQSQGGTPPAAAAGLLFEYGRLLAAASRPADAVPYLEAATRITPEDKVAWQQLGQALAAAGRGDEAAPAMQRFQDLLEAEGSDSQRKEQAAADLEDPTGRELRRALELLEGRQYDDALRIATREAAISPSDPRPVLLESRILLAAGRNEEALELAEQLVAALPSNADALYVRGLARVAGGDLDGAEADLRSALEVAPEHTAAMTDLAVLLADRGETGEARELLRRVLELRPGDPAATADLEGLGGG